MKKRKKYFDGYLTVEASFLVPITFVILMLLLYCGFYCYDKSVSVQCSYLAALRGAQRWDLSDTQQKEYAQEQLEKLIKENLLYIRTEKLYTENGIKEIRAGVTGGLDILVGNEESVGSKRWILDSEEKASGLKPTSYIRIYRIFGTE